MRWTKTICSLLLAAGMFAGLGASPALARDRDDHYGWHGRGDMRGNWGRHDGYRYSRPYRYYSYSYPRYQYYPRYYSQPYYSGPQYSPPVYGYVQPYGYYSPGYYYNEPYADRGLSLYFDW